MRVSLTAGFGRNGHDDGGGRRLWGGCREWYAPTPPGRWRFRGVRGKGMKIHILGGKKRWIWVIFWEEQVGEDLGLGCF